MLCKAAREASDMEAADAMAAARRARDVAGTTAEAQSGRRPVVPPRQALEKTLDDSSIKAAEADVDRLQKGALESSSTKDWLDSPIAQGVTGFLAAPKGTGLLSRIGYGAQNVTENRRKDATEDKAMRLRR